jgi:hypothetical protein
MADLLKNQAPSGLWRKLVDKPESWEETSGTNKGAKEVGSDLKKQYQFYMDRPCIAGDHHGQPPFATSRRIARKSRTVSSLTKRIMSTTDSTGARKVYIIHQQLFQNPIST